jgi:hypothetical protein
VAKLRSRRVGRLVPAPRAGEDGLLRLAQPQADPEELKRAFDRYRSAAGSDPAHPPASVALVEARLALTRLLVQDGWEPPASVLEQLGKDEEFLRPLSNVG